MAARTIPVTESMVIPEFASVTAQFGVTVIVSMENL